MQRFIARENIKHLEQKLRNAESDEQRENIAKLLEEARIHLKKLGNPDE